MLFELEIDKEFVNICYQIKAENKSEEDWALLESDDMFQSKNYVGGFEESEMEFCFSYFDKDRNEYWFQLPLHDVIQIAEGKKIKLILRQAKI